MRTGNARRGSGKRTALTSIESLLARLARLLVEHGVTSRQAETLLRAAWVQQVEHSLATHPRGPNVSWIALITGLDRKEVSRILKNPPRVDSALETPSHPASRVLAGWHSDPIFAKLDGPSALPIKSAGRRSPSFWALASRYSPGVYPALILRELCRVGAVEKLKDGRVRARLRRYRSKEALPRDVSRDRRNEERRL